MSTRSLEVLDFKGVQEGVVSRTVGRDGVVRMKILVKRHQLEQILQQVVQKNNNMGNHIKIRPVSKSLERRLKDIKRIQIQRSKQVKRNCRGYNWRPALQSIPESRVLII
ncbi:hypothetical protein L2E82_15727 [Cichorium intybus]|uniref:Uncharacterized protein n=1 Tax=Cichorium intybus TaxID=13427 RepID=A0ACB9F412_CICIN|nr:hypothetical protein L2E82_15727 [Cichorium intybus]